MAYLATYEHGRLDNPSPPMLVHMALETYVIISLATIRMCQNIKNLIRLTSNCNYKNFLVENICVDKSKLYSSKANQMETGVLNIAQTQVSTPSVLS